MARPYVLAENTWKTVKETNYELAVLPWGACEAHNYHLPYGTDIIEAEQVGAEAARIAWAKGEKVFNSFSANKPTNCLDAFSIVPRKTLRLSSKLLTTL